MFLDYYKLNEQPFGVTPDPRYLYFSVTHREALASILYSVSANRGFTALVASPGTGKTTVLFEFLATIRNVAKTVFIFQAHQTAQGLLKSILNDLGIEDDGTDYVTMYQKLNNCLANESRRGKRVVVVIDEAQSLCRSVLEVVRMLSNFETAQAKLIHFVLAGQPQLAETLADPGLVQLRQRISIVAKLTPLSGEDIHSYIDHRLRVAGYQFKTPVFTREAVALISEHTAGNPRDINNICFNAMSLGYVLNQCPIGVDIVQEVLDDLDLSRLYRPINQTHKRSVTAGHDTSDTPIQASSVDSSEVICWAKRKELDGLSSEVLWEVEDQTDIALRDLVPNDIEACPPYQACPSDTGRSKFAQTLWLEHSLVMGSSSSRPVLIAALITLLACPVFWSLRNLASLGPTTSPGNTARIVRAQPNETSGSIDKNVYGRIDAEFLTRVRELNPELEEVHRSFETLGPHNNRKSVISEQVAATPAGAKTNE
jgi:type II secretory pathway predicted ATPase ExeA